MPGTTKEKSPKVWTAGKKDADTARTEGFHKAREALKKAKAPVDPLQPSGGKPKKGARPGSPANPQKIKAGSKNIGSPNPVSEKSVKADLAGKSKPASSKPIDPEPMGASESMGSLSSKPAAPSQEPKRSTPTANAMSLAAEPASSPVAKFASSPAAKPKQTESELSEFETKALAKPEAAEPT